eukprot:7237356-Prymnesium_polylepis.1
MPLRELHAVCCRQHRQLCRSGVPIAGGSMVELRAEELRTDSSESVASRALNDKTRSSLVPTRMRPRMQPRPRGRADAPHTTVCAHDKHASETRPPTATPQPIHCDHGTAPPMRIARS